jgi:small subunit ribosomal protein S1
MIGKKLVSDPEGEIPDLPDEGWWAAVLSDEELYGSPRKENASKNNNQQAIESVDWPFVQRLFENDQIVCLKVHGFNRGGLLVQGCSVQGFVPISHLIDMPVDATDDEKRDILASYVDREINLKVIECEQAQERIVLSERAALAGEGKRRAIFDELKEGSCLTGRVTNVTDFGAFIDLGGVEGLIHVSELSWGRVHHPSDILAVDDEVRVMVLQVCEETCRIALSLKRMTPNPWETLTQRYKPGDIVPAHITTLTRFGAFARMEEGVEGLIHLSSITLPEGCERLSDYCHIGQKVIVRILHIDAERRRLGLGLVSLE